jgi:hypothetical protein
MFTFAYQVKINWLPNMPALAFNGQIEAQTKDEAKALIIDFYMIDLSVDKKDIEFVEIVEVE